MSRRDEDDFEPYAVSETELRALADDWEKRAARLPTQARAAMAICVDELLKLLRPR